MEEDRKVLDDLPRLVVAAKRGKAEDAQDQFVMVHRVLKSVSSAVRLTIGLVTVQKLDDGSSNKKKRNIGAYANGSWICSIPNGSCVENCSKHHDDSTCLDFLCGGAITPVHDEDEREAHAPFLVDVQGFFVLDFQKTTSFGSVEGAEALLSKSNENDTRIPDVDPCGCGSFNFGDGASSTATSLSRLPSLINQNRPH